MRRLVTSVIVLAAAAVVVVVWVVLGRPLRGVVDVDAARVTRGPLEVTLPVTGAVETRSVELAFDLPGRLRAVQAREGSRVRQGEVLAALDDAELRASSDQAASAVAAAQSDAGRAQAAVDAARSQAAQAAAAYRAARANLAQLRAGARATDLRQADAAVEAARVALDQARRILAVQEQLYQQGAVPKTQVEIAQAQVDGTDAQYRQVVAQRDAIRAGVRPEAIAAAEEQVRQGEAGVAAAQANVRQAQAASAAASSNVAQAEAAARAAATRAARAQLRAPFDGIVGRVYLNPGAPVAPNFPVVSLVSRDAWVIADVDEADIGKVRVGQRGRLTADAYPGRVWMGRVTRVAGQVDVRLGTRTVRVRVDLDAPAGMRAGTSVDVDLLLLVVPQALLIPLEALQDEENSSAAVYVIVGRVLRRHHIEPGERNESSIAVRAGLREGDLVAIADPSILRDGLRVRVRSVQ